MRVEVADAASAKPHNSSEVPILIGGLPRGGTTLMAQLLGSHSQIAVPPTELGFFDDVFGPNFDARTPIASRQEFEDRLSNVYRHRLHPWGLDESELLERSREVEPSYRGLFTFVLDAYRRKLGKQRMGEKTPKYERRMDVLDEWFGSFPFIQVVRHPFDGYASSRGFEGRRKIDILTWCHDWNLSATSALHHSSREPERYYVARYEDLIAEPRDILAQLCAFLDVELEIERMMAMDGYDVADNSSFRSLTTEREYDGGVRRNDALDRRGMLTREERETITSLCGPLAYLLGYELAPLRRRRGALGRLPYGRLPVKPTVKFVAGRLAAKARSAIRRSAAA